MNIAAWRAACDVWDLDRTAKHALQVICGHLGRPPATDVEVRIARLAVEMGVHYDTAYRALRRLRRTGYVSTVYRSGHTLLVTLNTDRLNLTPRADAETPPAPARKHPPRDNGNTPRAGAGTSGVIGYKRDGADGSSPDGPPSPAAGNGAVSAQTAPAHPDDCACAGTGWIEHPAGVVRCPAPARQRSRTTTRTRR